MLDIFNSQSMLFDVFDIATWFLVPDNLGPHAPVLRIATLDYRRTRRRDKNDPPDAWLDARDCLLIPLN
jgi:hypothetical protein